MKWLVSIATADGVTVAQGQRAQGASEGDRPSPTALHAARSEDTRMQPAGRTRRVGY